MPTHKTNSFKAFEAEHERSNPMVATLANRLVEIRKKNIAECLSDYEGSAHKLELVKTLNDIDFIDDARSNNANAVWFSLNSMTKPCVWITNVNTPEILTNELMQTIAAKVKAIVLQGVYNPEVYARLENLSIPVFAEMNLEDAVRQAFYICEKSYTVLFAPGVKNTAQLSSRELGNKFQVAVAQL